MTEIRTAFIFDYMGDLEELGRLNDEREALARMERPDPERVARLASRYAQKGMRRHAKEIMDTLA